MKTLFHRLTALILALLLLCSAGSVLSFAAQPGLPDSACELGADPKDMLAGGGKTLHTERGVFFVGEDGVYLLNGSAEPVLEGPACGLNYAGGVLYFARPTEEGSFDLCAFDLDRGELTVLLDRFSGVVGQLYLVNGQYLDFSCGSAIWQYELTTGDYRLIHYIKDLWSFVPTSYGLVYATGCLFRYAVYAGDELIAEGADDYYVDCSVEPARLVYTVDQCDYQVELEAAFAGTAEAQPFTGLDEDYLPVSAEAVTPAQRARNEELELARIQRELADIMNLPENRPDGADAESGEIPEPEEESQLSTEPEEESAVPTEEAPVETEEAPAEPTADLVLQKN